MKRVVGIAVLLLVLVVGCQELLSPADDEGGDAAPSEASESAEPDAEPEPSSEEPEAAEECREVPLATAERIADGDNDPPAIEPVAVAAYEAPGFEQRTFFVAVEFDTPGAEGSVGVWATAGIRGNPAPVVAVDGFAKEFTDWPDGDRVGLSPADPEVAEAVSCLDAAE